MHIPSLMKINWYWLKLSSRNEKSEVSGADNSVKNWQNLSTRSPQYQCTHQVWRKSIDIYWSYICKRKYGRMYNRRTDGHTDHQCETIIPCLYHVVGYNNIKKKNKKIRRPVAPAYCENMHHKSENCHPCLAQWDKTISKVKIKFWSLKTSFMVVARVYPSTQMNGQKLALLSPMLMQVWQKHGLEKENIWHI